MVKRSSLHLPTAVAEIQDPDKIHNYRAEVLGEQGGSTGRATNYKYQKVRHTTCSMLP
jgi:hypothetical protein